MKTIELMINGQKAQFTTKSVTLDGKEYLYSKMTQLDHSPVVLTYRFECDGEEKLLRYDKKDAKILAAIFSQVHKMIEQKKTKAAEKPAEPAKAPEAAEPESPAKAEEPAKTEVQEEEKAEDAETPSEESNTEEPAAEEVKEDASKEEKKEKDPMDPEKKAKLKKSLGIFGIILAVIVAASLIYYFVFGTSNAPNDAGPGVTESQQYEDIDQLIEDLQ